MELTNSIGLKYWHLAFEDLALSGACVHHLLHAILSGACACH